MMDEDREVARHAATQHTTRQHCSLGDGLLRLLLAGRGRQLLWTLDDWWPLGVGRGNRGAARWVAAGQ